MRPRLLIPALLLLAPVIAQVVTNYQVPLWNGKSYVFVSLDKSIQVVGGKLTALPAPVALAPNDVVIPTQPLASLTLRCAAGDIHRNGLLLSEGVDYTQTGLAVAFLSEQIPQAGDVVKVAYRCGP